MKLLAIIASLVLGCGVARAQDGYDGMQPTPGNRGTTGKTFLATFSKTGAPFTDPGTTSSITYLLDGGALDAYGTTITAVGTIPVSTATPFYPNGFGAPAAVGAGNLDDTHYLSIPSPGPWDLPGPGFSTCDGYTLNQIATFTPLGSHHNGANTNGWFMLMDGADRPSLWLQNGATNTQVVDNASLPVLNGLSLMCSGVTADGLSGFIESDLDVPVGATKVTSDPTKVTLLAAYLPDSTTAARIGSTNPGVAGLVLHGQEVWHWTSTTPATGDLLRSASRHFFGMYADTGQYFRDYCTTKNTYQINGTRWTAPAYVLRINEAGAKTNETSINYLLNSTAPATQTTAALAAGPYTGWMEGSGSVAFTLAAGSASGLPCTATTGVANDCHITASGGLTQVLATKVGTVTVEQLEPKAARTDLIITAGATASRGTETVWVPSLDIIDGALADNGTATVTPDSLATVSTSDLTLWSNPVGSTVQRLVHLGSSNLWELQIAGQTVDSAVAPLTAGAAVQVGWSWKTGAPVALTVNNVVTKSAGNAAAFLPGPILYTNSSATDGSNASLNLIQWNGRKRYPSFVAKTACIGDSLMATGTPPSNSPSSCDILGTLSGPKFNTTDFAVYGATDVQIAAQYTNSVQGQGFKVLVAEGAINNIGGGATAAATWGHIQPAVDAAVAAGMVVALVEVTPWNGTGNPSAIFPWDAGKQAQTIAYNADLAAEAAAHPTQVVVVPTYAAFGSAADATMQSALLDYGDATHHTQLAAGYQAQLIRDALVTLPPGSFQ